MIEYIILILGLLAILGYVIDQIHKNKAEADKLQWADTIILDYLPILGDVAKYGEKSTGNIYIKALNDYCLVDTPQGLFVQFAVNVPSVDIISENRAKLFPGISSVNIVMFGGGTINDIPSNTAFINVYVASPAHAEKVVQNFIDIITRLCRKTVVPVPYPGYFFAKGGKLLRGMADLRPMEIEVEEGVPETKEYAPYVPTPETPFPEMPKVPPTPSMERPPLLSEMKEEEILPIESYGILDFEKIKNFFEPVTLGYGIGPNAGKEIKFDLLGLNKHGFVAGSTGGGKTYAVASAIVEQCLERKIPVLIIDPTDRWTSLVKPNISPPEIESQVISNWIKETGLEKPAPKGYSIRTIYVGIPMKDTIYDETLKIAVKDLDENELCELISMVKDMTALQNTTLRAVRRILIEKKPNFTLDDIADLLGDIIKNPKKYSKMFRIIPDKAQLKWLIQRIEGLQTLLPGIFVSSGSTQLTEEPTVITFSSVIKTSQNIPLYDAIVAYILRLVSQKWGTKSPTPTKFASDTLKRLVILEEAHLCCPAGEDTPAKEMASYLVRMERKSGIGVLFITQLPTDLDVEQITANTSGLRMLFSIASEMYPKTKHHFTSKEWETVEQTLAFIAGKTGICIVSGDAVGVSSPTIALIAPRKSSNAPLSGNQEYKFWKSKLMEMEIEEKKKEVEKIESTYKDVKRELKKLLKKGGGV